MHAGCFLEFTILALALCWCRILWYSPGLCPGRVTPYFGFVLFFWCSLLIYDLPAGCVLECGLRPHSFLITLLALALCCFLVASSNLWFACRVLFGMWPSATFFFNHTLVWALCCFLVASSNLWLPAGCFVYWKYWKYWQFKYFA